MTAPVMAAILALEGQTLSAAESALFRQANPLGFILFARNIDSPAQLRDLTASLRECVGRDCPILIDQEGGRVARLKPPHWKTWPPARDYGVLYDRDPAAALAAVARDAAEMAATLRDLGVTVDCAPVLDVLDPATHDVIGDRAYSADPAICAELGAALCRAFLAEGVTPVIKHIPGHGRATADSHEELPVVTASLDELRRRDFEAFRLVSRQSFAPSLWGMTAHVLYAACDPHHPATSSPAVIHDVIRREIGFDGFLLGDDVGMGALAQYGDLPTRATLSLEAGCDSVLYCAGKLEEMIALTQVLPPLSAESQARLDRAQGWCKNAA